MDITFLLKGLVIGFVIAAPLGPIGILCARRTLTHGRKAGFLSGMGASTADVLYGFIAAFGLTFISDFLLSYQFWLRLAGGVILCFIGVKTFMEKPDRKGFILLLEEKKRHTGMYTSTFLLTLTNPLTIFSLAAVFAGVGIVGTKGNVLSAAVLILGVFLGSVLWWLFIVGALSVFEKQLKRHELLWISRIAGLIIAVSGALALASLVYNY
jgi:threonine/homoserine/homoserine lactone efflux protein